METREIFDLVAVSIILIAAMAPICGYILDKSWDNAPGKNREMNSEH
jgi:MFS-type transporter involved in bile tolerance (Atg22 family)